HRPRNCTSTKLLTRMALTMIRASSVIAGVRRSGRAVERGAGIIRDPDGANKARQPAARGCVRGVSLTLSATPLPIPPCAQGRELNSYTRAPWGILFLLAMALLTGCASENRIPSAPPGFPANATGDARWQPAQQVLKARGLYLDNLGQVLLLDDSHCTIRIEAHRGHPRLAENSLVA